MQCMYVHPNGEPGRPKMYPTPKRADPIKWYKAACKVLAQEIGSGPEVGGLFGYHKVDMDENRLIYYMTNGGMIVIDRKANGLGR